MGKIVFLFVLFSIVAAAIIFCIARIRSEKTRFENAKRRFDAALNKLLELKDDYFVKAKREDYLEAEVRLLKHSAGSDPVEWYDRHADEVEAILESPFVYLRRKVYDPVDNSLLREDAVEVACDHPTAGKIYIMVNQWNVDKVDQIFRRKTKYRASRRFYQMRMDRELPQDTTVIHQDDGITLTDILLLNYLLTDRHVPVREYYEEPTVRRSHPNDGNMDMLHAGHEDLISDMSYPRANDDNAIIATSDRPGVFGWVSDSAPDQNAPAEHQFGGGDFGGGGASGSLDDGPVIVDPFESAGHSESDSGASSEIHDDAPAETPADSSSPEADTSCSSDDD